MPTKKRVIYVSEETKERLTDFGLFGETFDDIIWALMENYENTHNNVRGIRRKR